MKRNTICKQAQHSFLSCQTAPMVLLQPETRDPHSEHKGKHTLKRRKREMMEEERDRETACRMEEVKESRSADRPGNVMCHVTKLCSRKHTQG